MKHNFSIEKTARYYSEGTFSAQTKNIWFVLHGYGQLASYFIKHFGGIVDDQTVVIAPEGHSRFYLSGVDGRIGASWMTREDRLDEIHDYQIYLDQLYTHLITSNNLDPANLKITLLGFSQGGATATRWLEFTKHPVHHFLLWSSVFPEDMLKDSLKNIFQTQDCVVIYGDDDPYLTSERATRLNSLEKNTEEEGDNSNVEVLRFKGGHSMNSETLKKIALRINK